MSLPLALRRVAAKLTLAAAGVVLALAIAEGLTRWLAPQVREHVVPGGLFAADALLGWKLRPDMRAVHRTRSFSVEYAINPAGFRDRARAADKPPGIRRVLVYGDSQVFGWGVPVTARFSDLVEAHLPGIEVWNLGVPGYGLDQQLLAYERDGDGREADDVLLFVSSSTLMRAHHGTMYRKPKPRFVLDAQGALILRAPPGHVMDWFYPLLSRFSLPYLVERWQLAAEPEPPPRPSAPPPRPVLDPLAAALLTRGHAVAHARHQQLIVLAALDDNAAVLLRDACAPRGIAFLNVPFPAGADLRLSPYDPHWNARAHEVVASHLAAFLQPAQGG